MREVKLSELLNNVSVIQTLGNAEERVIKRISADSRNVDEHTVFIAVSGFRFDAHDFVQEVVSKNAAAVVIEKNIFPDELFTRTETVKILVKDSRKALAEFSNAFYGFPSRKLKLTGITGTKGKTTTAFLLKGIFDYAGIKSGLIGTVKNIIGEKETRAKLTTPESYELNEMFSEMLEQGVTHCVMEVSSHALSLKRVHGLDFDFAGFTNLASDHLDFYQTRLNYFLAKKILFDELKPEAVAVVNINDEHGEKIVEHSKARVVAYGEKNESDFRIENIEFDLTGTRFDLIFNNKTRRITTTAVGAFNAYNATLAFAIAYEHGIDEEKIIEGIARAPRVPGRFEVVEKNGKIAIIDYAHTAGSLEKTLIALREIVKNKKKIFTVFGAGGDRDRSKRPKMGAVAEKYSDKIFVTSDNPRTENPERIIKDILEGIKSKDVYVNPDREKAIAEAISQAGKDAVVLIAGKGHEDYQEINGVRHHFSDKEIAEKYLSE